MIKRLHDGNNISASQEFAHYRELRKAIQNHREKGNIAGLELCDKPWNGKNWRPKEPDNLSFTWRTN